MVTLMDAVEYFESEEAFWKVAAMPVWEHDAFDLGLEGLEGPGTHGHWALWFRCGCTGALVYEDGFRDGPVIVWSSCSGQHDPVP